MRNITSILFLITFFLNTIGYGINNGLDLTFKNKSKKLVKLLPVKFIENKGQMVDMDGIPVPSVLFKVHSQNYGCIYNW